MSEMRHPMSETRHPMSELRHKMSQTGQKMSHSRHLMSQTGLPGPDLKLPTLPLLLPNEEINLPALEIRFPILDLYHPIKNLLIHKVFSILQPAPMAKTTPPANSSSGTVRASSVSYAYKPARIGAVISRLMKEKRITKQYIADTMQVAIKTVERWMDADFISMPHLLQLSVIFGENLLLLYHPDVKPLPNPLQAEVDKQTGYVKHLEDIEIKYAKLREENKSLRDQVEVLKELIERMKGR